MAKRYHNPDKGYMKPEAEYRQEEKDAALIKNDHSKFANLPTEVMMKAYPPCPAYMDWEMEDNIKGIDKQIGNDNSKRRGGMDPHKY
jgi:hypothetical protein